METVIAALVQHYGITVVDSANDGTRLYTPTAVGPDGGATPTNVAAQPGAATDINDDAVLHNAQRGRRQRLDRRGRDHHDDTLAVSPQDGGNAWRNPTYTETRTDGGANFASGWGQRVTLSAPGDNIPGVRAPRPGRGLGRGGAQRRHVRIGPADRGRRRGRPAGRAAHPPAVRPRAGDQGPAGRPGAGRDAAAGGPAAERRPAGQRHRRGRRRAGGRPRETAETSIVRLSVAHRVDINNTGAAFTEYTDPGDIDLQDPRPARLSP